MSYLSIDSNKNNTFLYKSIEHFDSIQEIKKNRFIDRFKNNKGTSYYWNKNNLLFIIDDPSAYLKEQIKYGASKEYLEKNINSYSTLTTLYSSDFFAIASEVWKYLQNAFIDEKYKILKDIPLRISFDSSINSGVNPCQNGEVVVSISYSTQEIQHWLSILAMIHREGFAFAILKEARKIHGTSFMYALRLLAYRAIYGLPLALNSTHLPSLIDKELNLDEFKTTQKGLRYLETFSSETKYIEIEYIFIIAFIVCHEAAHLVLGHLKELKDYRENSTKDNYIKRRKQMELESDSWSYGHAEHILRLNDENALKAHNALADFYAMHNLAIMHDEELLNKPEYPTSEERLVNIVETGTYPSKNKVMNLLMERYKLIPSLYHAILNLENHWNN